MDRAPAQCLGGHGFDSCRGLRIFLCPTLMSGWLIHLHISLPSLKFTIFINKQFHIQRWHFVTEPFFVGVIAWQMSKCLLFLSRLLHRNGQTRYQNKKTCFYTLWNPGTSIHAILQSASLPSSQKCKIDRKPSIYEFRTKRKKFPLENG